MFQIYERLRWVYLTVFGVQVIPISAMIVWREAETGGHTHFSDLLIASLQKIDDVCYLALITSVIIVDIGRYLMGILLKAPQDRAYEQGFTVGNIHGKAEGKAEGLVEGKAQGKAEGIAAGAAEERERWLDYDRRVQEWELKQKDSQDKGEPFDEPRPKPPIS